MTFLYAGFIQAQEIKTKSDWLPAFTDEFNGRVIDQDSWNTHDPWKEERNNELQAYVEDAFEIKNGILFIKASKRQAMYDGEPRQYTSGIITTYKKFSQKFGRFEIRCRVPKGKGLWPVFWLLPEPLGWPPEIDVFEILGNNPNIIFFANHWRTWWFKHKTVTGHWIGPDFSQDFHVIALEWHPEVLIWYVDGVERFRTTEEVPHENMYMIVNLAVGGDWPGSPDETTEFPCSLEVDYVRVYTKATEDD